jgi:anti-anti-sigma regulatory factor
LIKNQPLSWEVIEKNEETLVVFTGNLNEKSSRLEELKSLAGKVIFDLAGIYRINSVGVTHWINFINDLQHVSELSLVRCSIPVVGQLNMVRDFKGKSQVISFYAPYVCPETGDEEEILLTREDLGDSFTPPKIECEDGEMVLDDLPKRYFTFLMPRTRKK